MRAVLALLLSLILGLASLSEAVARSEMAGARMTEACGATVLLDATGKPIVAPHCAHCLAAQPVALPSGPATPLAPQRRGVTLRPEALGPALSQPLPAALARGPPALM